MTFRYNYGQAYKEINFDDLGVLNYRYEINYTKFNRPSELIEYGANGELFEKWNYFYTPEHQIGVVLQFDSNLQLYKKYVNSYDENGNQTEIVVYNKEGKAIEKRVSIYQYY